MQPASVLSISVAMQKKNTRNIFFDLKAMLSSYLFASIFTDLISRTFRSAYCVC